MFEQVNQRMSVWAYRMWDGIYGRGIRVLRSTKGQGTTEYAILVGVLVVIAIIAVVAFRGKLQELWGAISEAINSL
jgi:Flp pilus assembly pilin Flp